MDQLAERDEEEVGDAEGEAGDAPVEGSSAGGTAPSALASGEISSSFRNRSRSAFVIRGHGSLGGLAGASVEGEQAKVSSNANHSCG